jgi:hypothetical protein
VRPEKYPITDSTSDKNPVKTRLALLSDPSYGDLSSIRVSPSAARAAIHRAAIRFISPDAYASMRVCAWRGCRRGNVQVRPRLGKSGGTSGRAERPRCAQMGTGSLACWHDQRYSVAYLRAISLTWSFVSCFGGTPGGLQVSRKKPSRPGGATIQSSSNS